MLIEAIPAQPVPDTQMDTEQGETAEGGFQAVPVRNGVEICLEDREEEDLLLLLDGEEQEIPSDRFILPAAPGFHTLSLIRMDENGKCLDSEFLNLWVEAVQPALELRIGEEKLQSEWLLDPGAVPISVSSDVPLESVLVTLDGREVSVEDDCFLLEEDTYVVEVQIRDGFGNTARTELQIVRTPEIQSFQNPVINGDLQIRFSRPVQEGWTLEWTSGSLDLSGLEQVDLHLEQAGEQTLRLIHTRSGTETLLQTENRILRPSFQIQTIWDEKMESVTVHTDVQDASSWKILVSSQGTVQEVQDSFQLRGESGTVQDYTVQAEMVDAAGETHTETRTVQIDRREPQGALYLDGRLIDPGSRTAYSTVSEARFEHNGTLSARFSVLEKALEKTTLLEALHSLQAGEILEASYTVSLDNGKSAVFPYSFEWVPIQAASVVDVLGDQIRTDYLLKSDGSLVSSRQIESSRQEQSRIRLSLDYQDISEKKLENGQVVRIWLEDPDSEGEAEITGLAINGEKVSPEDIRRDALGNPYYDLRLFQDEYQLSIEARDSQGNVLKENRTLQVEQTSRSLAWLWCLPAGLAAVLAVLIVRRRRKKCV